MTNSTQVNTAPTLRQFATIADEHELIVTSKLGASTLSRVRFKRLEYPNAEVEQPDFLKGLVLGEYPVARDILGQMFDLCIRDQVKAVNELLGGREGA